MKNLFFLSAAAFAIAFALGQLVNVLWPIPMDFYAEVSNPTADMFSMIAWYLGLIGFLAFVFGCWNKYANK